MNHIPKYHPEKNIESESVDVKDLLSPPDNMEAVIDLDLIQFHQGAPPREGLQYLSSSLERLQHFPVKRLDTLAKKQYHKRIRLIIAIDILLAISIFGVVYPAIQKLQTTGELHSYYFNIKQTYDTDRNTLDLLIKTRFLIQKSENLKPSKTYHIHIVGNETLIVNDEMPLPNIQSPIQYKRISIPFAQLRNKTKYISLTIAIGSDKRHWKLPVKAVNNRQLPY